MEMKKSTPDSDEAKELERQERRLVVDMVENYGFEMLAADFEHLASNQSDSSSSEQLEPAHVKIIKKYSRVLNVMKDFYFEYS
mmetsp:Transcript_17989/g.30628  ORF Transcript_17989/g.30628 Transcript_17989/m.30628 type:complete len:83 (+) Transcript_17989:169-417(+)